MGDLLFHGGDIVPVDPRYRNPRAVLVRNGEIVYVGAEHEARVLAKAPVEQVDLSGKCLIPGFNDNHVHAVMFGDRFLTIDISGLNVDAIIERLRDSYRGAGAGELIYATGWDYTTCPNPHRRLLDEAFPNNPVMLIQFSGHGMWVNTHALRLIDPVRIERRNPLAHMVRDDAGEPTGVLLEMSNNRLWRRRVRSFHFDRVELRRRLDLATQAFAASGMTSVQDNTWFHPTVSALRSIHEEGDLALRFTCWAYGENALAAVSPALMPFVTNFVDRGPWKYFLDGTFSTRTAWLIEPYADRPNSTGHGVPSGRILKTLRRLATRRRQGAFHAIGDRAVAEFVDAWERATRAGAPKDLRMRLEHAQVIAPRDIGRIAKLGIHVAAQPHAASDFEKDVRLLGEGRARRAYPYRSLLDAGVPLSFGSDIPGEATYPPLLGMHLAVNHPGDEAISAEEALTAYTLGSARAQFREGVLGSISVGKRADLTVLSANPLTIDPEKLRGIEVCETYVDGVRRYAADDTG